MSVIQQQWIPGDPPTLVNEFVTNFDGQADPDIEQWLESHGAFVSWLPSEEAVVLIDYSGGEVTARKGATIVYDTAGLEAFCVYNLG